MRKAIQKREVVFVVVFMVSYTILSPPFDKTGQETTPPPDLPMSNPARRTGKLVVDAGPDKTIFTNVPVKDGQFVRPVSTQLHGGWWFEDGSDSWIFHDNEQYDKVIKRKRIQTR